MAPLPDEHGDPAGCLCLVADINDHIDPGGSSASSTVCVGWTASAAVSRRGRAVWCLLVRQYWVPVIAGRWWRRGLGPLLGVVGDCGIVLVAALLRLLHVRHLLSLLLGSRLGPA